MAVFSDGRRSARSEASVLHHSPEYLGYGISAVWTGPVRRTAPIDPRGRRYLTAAGNAACYEPRHFLAYETSGSWRILVHGRSPCRHRARVNGAARRKLWEFRSHTGGGAAKRLCFSKQLCAWGRHYLRLQKGTGQL